MYYYLYVYVYMYLKKHFLVISLNIYHKRKTFVVFVENTTDVLRNKGVSIFWYMVVFIKWGASLFVCQACM